VGRSRGRYCRSSGRIVELDTRSDCDDDDVACVAHALETVVSPQPAQNVIGAVDRAIAAAYDRVPYPEGAIAFRPLSEDTRDPAVQHELAWQAWTLTILEHVDDFADACAQVLREGNVYAIRPVLST
jgi:hypothetical protein